MNKNEKFVITINRELGSGGRTVGRKLAEKLGVEFYDKLLIQELEKKYNLTFEEIEKLKGRNHSWWEDFKRVARIGEGWHVAPGKGAIPPYRAGCDLRTTAARPPMRRHVTVGTGAGTCPGP